MSNLTDFIGGSKNFNNVDKAFNKLSIVDPNFWTQSLGSYYRIPIHDYTPTVRQTSTAIEKDSIYYFFSRDSSNLNLFVCKKEEMYLSKQPVTISAGGQAATQQMIVSFLDSQNNIQIFTIGGYTKDSNGNIVTQTDNYNYDHSNDIWTQKAAVPVGRYNSGICHFVSNGSDYIMIIGGKDNNGNGTSDVCIYDVVNDSWTTKNNFPVSLTSPIVQSYNGEIYVADGDTNNPGIYKYDSTNDAWNKILNDNAYPILINYKGIDYLLLYPKNIQRDNMTSFTGRIKIYELSTMSIVSNYLVETFGFLNCPLLSRPIDVNI